MSPVFSGIPDGITPVTGWRAWRVEGDELSSIHSPSHWPVGSALTSICQRRIVIGGTGGLMFRYEELAHKSGPASDYRQSTGEHVVKFGEVDFLLPRQVTPVKLPAPRENCSCGIYAASSLDGAMKHGNLVIGRVALWGTVIVHESGWRGEFAYPQALYVNDPKARAVAERYGVPVFGQDQLPKRQKETASFDGICRRCGHVRAMHGHPEFGCLRCPTKTAWWSLGLAVRRSCEFVE